MFNVILSISSVYEEFCQTTQECEPVHLEGRGALHSGGGGVRVTFHVHTSSWGVGGVRVKKVIHSQSQVVLLVFTMSGVRCLCRLTAFV